MNADGGQERLKLVDRRGLAVDLEIESGGGSAGLVGARDVDDCFADGDDCALELASQSLQVLRAWKLLRRAFVNSLSV